MVSLKKILALVAWVLSLSGAQLSNAQDRAETLGGALVLSDEGVSKAVIGVNTNDVESTQTAARDLAEELKKITGAEFPIVDVESLSPEQNAILVGGAADGTLAKLGVDLNSLGTDGIAIKTHGNRLLLSGGEPRGVLYSVYTFLEKNLGVEWWTPSAGFSPKAPSLSVPELDTVYKPKFLYRDPFYRELVKDPAFGAKMKRNGFVQTLDSGIPKSLGGHMGIIGFCHTFYSLIPPSIYFEKHPEWFSEIDGKRTADNAQLCLTNVEMRKELTQRAIEMVKADPDAGIISISQMDNQRRCQCANCLEVEAVEGAPSGPLIQFVNDVAAEIAKVAPNFFVDTLAYQYTQKPPLHVLPADNVIIRLCSVECDNSVPLDDPKNAVFMEDLTKWSAIAKNLFIWDYTVDFQDCLRLHPNLKPLTKNVPIFAQNGAIGVFEQGYDAAEQFSDFIALKAWVVAHLLWNPAEDANVLTDRFLNGYYGAAAPYLKEYLTLMDGAIRSNGKLPGFGEPDLSGIDAAVLTKAEKIFDQAEAAVEGQPDFLNRVRVERISLKYARIIRYLATVGVGLGKENFDSPAAAAAACDVLLEEAVALGISPQTKMGYNFTLKTLLEMRKDQCLTPIASDPKETDGLERTSWADFQETRIVPAGLGDMATIVDDSAASNARAVRMKQGVGEWAIQVHAPANPAAATYQCYLVARSESPGEDGLAFQAGIYNDQTKESKTLTDVSVAESRGSEYKTFDLGEHALGPNNLIWVVTSGEADPRAAVLVDRVFMIEKK